jgi:DNA adenine methylase
MCVFAPWPRSWQFVPYNTRISSRPMTAPSGMTVLCRPSATASRRVPLQPLLRWAGSKRKLVSILQAYAPQTFVRYYEPFAGSACLFLALRPSAAVLGDLNQDLIHTYSVVRSHPRLVSRLMHRMPRTSSFYYQLRAIRPETLDELTRAARFLYLNHYCFNGVYRANAEGQFNVPRGTKTGALKAEAEFVRVSIALRGVELRCCDFEACVADIATGDFVYLDPPYARPGQRNRGEYGPGCFEYPDLPRLLSCLKRIDHAGGHFLFSYRSSPSVLRDVSCWYVKRLRVRRHVSGFAKHRQVVEEVLVSNSPFTMVGA